MSRTDPRAREIAIIHIARDQLDMDEETYRAMLRRVTGKVSASKLSMAERNNVILELRRLGFQPAPMPGQWPGRPRNTREVPMLRKVEALLADAKRPWAYAHAMAARMFGVARVEWLGDERLHKLVAAMQADANRRKRRR